MRALLLLMLLSCSPSGVKAPEPEKQADTPSPEDGRPSPLPVRELFYARNFDSCLDDERACLRSVKADDFTYSDRLRLVRLLPSSDVYEKISLDNIRGRDLKTLKGAAFPSALRNLSMALEKAEKNGFSVPELISIDPLCSMPLSQNNAWFLPEHGYDDRVVRNSICLGIQFRGGEHYPLALDRFVSSHELYHALLYREIVGTDGVVPDQAMFLSHDLDSFNEGAADFFSQAVADTTLNRFFRRLLPWRLSGQRTTLGFKHGPHGHIYRDGMKWTELFEELDFRGDALPVLSCTGKEISAMLRRAKSRADDMDRDADHRYAGQLLRFNFWDFGWSVYDADILQAVRNCTPENLRPGLEEIIAGLFPAAPAEKPASKAEVALIMFPSRQSLCRFQKDYQLGPWDISRYEYTDPCNNAFSQQWAQAAFSMAAKKQAPDSFSGRKNESSFVLPGVRLLDGYAAGCTLRGTTAPDFSEIRLIDARRSEIGPDGKKFSHQIFMNTRGSWYRDVPLGSFLPDTDNEIYRLRGLLSLLSRDGFRFVSRPTEDGYPSSGLSGYFWLTTSDYREGVTQNSQLTEWAENTLRPYYVSKGPPSECRENPDLCRTGMYRAVGEKCLTGSEDCSLTANYFIECTSHQNPKSPEDPLGTGGRKIRITSSKAYIYDCSVEEAACDLRSY